MSSAEEDSLDSERHNYLANGPKKRRMQRACDVCRRRKIRCDGTEQPHARCSNCVASEIECTYIEAKKKKEPPKRTLESLDSRLNRMEKLLDKLSTGRSSAPAVALKKPNSNEENSGQSASSAHPSATRSDTPDPASWPCPPDKACIVDPDDLGLADKEYVIVGLEEHFKNMSIDCVPPRYMGKSSGFELLHEALNLKHGYIKDLPPSRKPESRIRPEFWSRCPWEDQKVVEVKVAFQFPPDDLMDSLIDKYFFHINSFYPLLYEPGFKSDVARGLHLHDQTFASLLLLVCACASRWSDDPRVLLEGYETWHSAGWKYFNQLQARMANKSLLAPTSLHDLQSFAVATIFFSGTSASETGWMTVGAGIRHAEDLGVHRRQAHRKDESKIEVEQWKRTFWVLVALDRDFSATLGRPYAVQDEDFDLDMPIECDDEFWVTSDPQHAFKQPTHRPSKISYFIWAIKLDQILAFAHRTIYSINKSKLMMGFVGKEWEKRIVSQLDSALNEWVDSLPDHLRWDPYREDPVFFMQSAYLYCAYYRLQILVHRPFIPKPGKSSVLPSLAICTNAARSYIHVIDILRKRSSGPFLHLIYPGLFGSCIVLLFNIWAGKRSGLSLDPTKEMQEVFKGMLAMKHCDRRWFIAGRLYDMLCQLGDAGDVPLPEPSPPPNKKRVNEHDDEGGQGEQASRSRLAGYQNQDISHTASAAVTPTAHPAISTDSYLESVAILMNNSDIPIHSDELARLPIHVSFDELHTNVRSASSFDTISNAPEMGNAMSNYVCHAVESTFESTGSFLPHTALDTYQATDYNNAFANGGTTSQVMSPAAPFSFCTGFDMSGQPLDPVISDEVFNMWSAAPSGFGFDEWGNFITNFGENSSAPH